MRPRVSLPGTARSPARITVLIVKRDSAEATAQFRHLVLKTHDPADRYDAALRLLSAAYFQRPQEFADEMTALFNAGSDLAKGLLQAGKCRLDFAQFSQSYSLPCRVRTVAEHDPAFQATYWHNRLFNATMPSRVWVLAFAPDWERAAAEPAQ